MRIRKHKKIIINFIIILSIWIISLNQVFANERYNTNAKLGNLVKVAAPITQKPIQTPTNTYFDSAELIEANGSKKWYGSSMQRHFYKFVPQITGEYTISSGTGTTSNSINVKVSLYDSTKNQIASNVEVFERDDVRNRVTYKTIINYTFIEGQTYYIVVSNISVGFNISLIFGQEIKESKKQLLSVILNANKIHDEAVEGNLVGQYKVGSKTVFKSVIMKSQQVIGNIDSTQTDINNALTNLNNALINFQKMKNIDVSITKYDYEYDSVSHRLRYILKDGKRIVEFIYDDNGNLKQKKKIIN